MTHSRRTRFSALVAGLAGLAGVAFAADEKPAAPSPADSGITAAKKEFEAVKSSRDQGLQQRNDLPRVTLPQMQSDSGSSAGAALRSQKTGQPEKKSTNWLLEAMEKKDARRDRERDRTAKSESNKERLERDAPDGTEKNEPDRVKEPDRKPTSITPDPMARFLSDWMTPQDYALLKPGLERSMNEAAGNGTSPLATSLLGGTGIDAVASAGGVLTRTQGIPATPRENPYLSALNLTPPPATPAAPIFVAPPPPTPSPASGPLVAPIPPPVAPPKAKLPDFVKPSQDEKYYKQLKRF